MPERELGQLGEEPVRPARHQESLDVVRADEIAPGDECPRPRGIGAQKKRGEWKKLLTLSQAWKAGRAG